MPAQTLVSRAFFAAVVLAVLSAAVSCSHHLPLPSAISRIEVKSNQNKTLLVIKDFQKIRAVIAFLSGKSENWHVPSDPFPSASLILHFYMQEEHVGEFSIGENFFMASWEGIIYSKIVKEREKKRTARYPRSLRASKKIN
ncbi:MAG: hypothetical protein JNM63_15420 [Spirochaetia bacterium]|nr:hypothetical protein [Spirochaetia bacterium]